MGKNLTGFLLKARSKIQYMALGLGLGLGTGVLNQGRLTSGQCATCGACMANVQGLKLPLLTLPVLLGGIVTVFGKDLGKWTAKVQSGLASHQKAHKYGQQRNEAGSAILRSQDMIYDQSPDTTIRFADIYTRQYSIYNHSNQRWL